MKITSSHTAVIAGLKTFLMEVAADLVTNLDDAIFNVEAQPFKPTKTQEQLPQAILQ